MGTITCSNCKLQGHKYTSCTQPLKPDLAIRKNNHKVIYENLYLCAIYSITTAFLIMSIYNEMLQPSRTMPPPGSTVPSASAPSASAPSASAPSATAPSASAPSASTASASAPSASTAPPAPRSSATRPPTAPAAPRSSATRPPTAPPGPRSSAQGRSQGVYSYFTAGANASARREPGVGPLGN
jgi:cytoskeletal protein RodZ